MDLSERLVSAAIIALVGMVATDVRTLILKMLKRFSKKTDPKTRPAIYRGKMMAMNKIGKYQRWRTLLVFVSEFAIMAYVLSLASAPGDVTKWYVYKIAFWVGAFLFILIQSSISALATSLFSIPPDQGNSPDSGGNV